MNTEYQNWQVETATSSRSEDIEYFIRRDGDSVAVASDIINPETEQPSKEIADLLCAAPDLLAALKSTWKILDAAGLTNLATGVQTGSIAWYCKASDAEQQSRAAIAKAEGKA